MILKLNTQQLEISLRNVANRATKAAAGKMRTQALKIRDLARSFAPYDDGDLHDAIKMMTIKDPTTQRNVFVVYVDPDALGSGPNQVVGDYAMLVERNMAPHGSGNLNGRRFVASARSLARSPAAGGRFMRRAMDRALGGLQGQVANEVRRVLGGGKALLNNTNPMMTARDYAETDQ